MSRPGLVPSGPAVASVGVPFRFESDPTHTLTREGFAAMLEKVLGNFRLDERELDVLFSFIDRDGSGQIDVDELRSAIYS